MAARPPPALQPGDIILEVNRQTVDSPDDLREASGAGPTSRRSCWSVARQATCSSPFDRTRADGRRFRSQSSAVRHRTPRHTVAACELLLVTVPRASDRRITRRPRRLVELPRMPAVNAASGTARRCIVGTVQSLDTRPSHERSRREGVCDGERNDQTHSRDKGFGFIRDRAGRNTSSTAARSRAASTRSSRRTARQLRRRAVAEGPSREQRPTRIVATHSRQSLVVASVAPAYGLTIAKTALTYRLLTFSPPASASFPAARRCARYTTFAGSPIFSTSSA